MRRGKTVLARLCRAASGGSISGQKVSQDRENGLRGAAEGGLAVRDQKGPFDQARVGGHGGDEVSFVRGVTEAEVAELCLDGADESDGGLAEKGKRRVDFIGRGWVLEIEADGRAMALRLEKRERFARFRAARVMPERQGQSQFPRPVPTASATVANPSRARSASSPRAISGMSERPR